MVWMGSLRTHGFSSGTYRSVPVSDPSGSDPQGSDPLESDTPKHGQTVAQLRQRQMLRVARGKQRMGHRPGDPDAGVVPGDADLARRVVQLGALVLDLRNRTDHAEAV